MAAATASATRYRWSVWPGIPWSISPGTLGQLPPELPGQYQRNLQHECIYLTIHKLKQDKGFPELVNDLRSKGWRDWQITIAIMNFMLNAKTRYQLSDKEFENENRYQEAFEELFHKLLHTDEKDCYMEFPLSTFQSEEFQFELNHTLVLILDSYRLENRANFPNFSAVKNFLDVRFNLQNDNSNEGNLLADI